MMRIGLFVFDVDGKCVKIKSFVSFFVFLKEVLMLKVWLILVFLIEVVVNFSDKRIILVV